MNRNDKRSAICRLSFLPIGQATVSDQPGNRIIKVRGSFNPVPIASGEFRETEEQGELVEQELTATVTDTGSDHLAGIRDLFAQDGLVRLTFTNGEQRVVGTGEFPVHVNAELSGTPQVLTLSFRRNSAEPAKNYSSF